jgi:hypothetical protein
MSDPGNVQRDNSSIDSALLNDPLNHETIAVSKSQLDEYIVESNESNL